MLVHETVIQNLLTIGPPAICGQWSLWNQKPPTSADMKLTTDDHRNELTTVVIS
ncbi:hypothetical protein DPMN_022307 [Dreissena polymorpha]|uniref:Uncharacterized protein n=1 Tax=Dreissena polymorpha TaxID=45954 RepID=A0A9D4NP83_DREPO|nr:hypothetical protein DPMN_022271 [Dreissena polymorpha]KAH3898106.1 hypothetical protein DPMN_022307 [Dreissena polymorpha]